LFKTKPDSLKGGKIKAGGGEGQKKGRSTAKKTECGTQSQKSHDRAQAYYFEKRGSINRKGRRMGGERKPASACSRSAQGQPHGTPEPIIKRPSVCGDGSEEGTS